MLINNDFFSPSPLSKRWVFKIRKKLTIIGEVTCCPSICNKLGVVFKLRVAVELEPSGVL